VNDTDSDIIEQVRAGNTRRYAVLVDRHKDRMLTLACRLLGRREEAEELVQDAFMRAFRSLDRFRGDAKFSTWLYRILHNLCMTKVSRRRRVDVEEDEEQVIDTLADDGSPSVQEQLEDEEMRGILKQEMNLLPEKYRSVVALFYIQEMSYEEVVSILNLPVGTVKTNLFRARNLLKGRILARMKGEMSAA
jgi:RNA polymerase sigma-70 factor (ECF subfamily)